MSDAKSKQAHGGGCPICGDPRDETYRPFCSKRCADVDLGKWMNGAYAVPAAEEDDPEAEELQRRAEDLN